MRACLLGYRSHAGKYEQTQQETVWGSSERACESKHPLWPTTQIGITRHSCPFFGPTSHASPGVRRNGMRGGRLATERNNRASQDQRSRNRVLRSLEGVTTHGRCQTEALATHRCDMFSSQRLAASALASGSPIQSPEPDHQGCHLGSWLFPGEPRPGQPRKCE